MHPTTERLYEAARELRKTTGQSAVAFLIGESPQTVKNWESRGISNQGAINAASVIGCNAQWLKMGIGQMADTPHDQRNSSEIPSGTVRASSDTKTVRAPVVVWARLGTDLYKESSLVESTEYIRTPEGASTKCKWFVAEEGIPSFRIKKGYKLALDPCMDGHSFVNDDLYLFKDLDGSMFLAEFRKIAGGSFEAVTESGRVLEKEKHGLSVIAIHRGTWK